MSEAGLLLDCWPTSSRLESSLVMYQVLRSEHPMDYRRRLRLNLPWFVTITSGDAFPRLALVNRIPNGEEPVFGPFKSRDGAQRYAEDVLGCFNIRRCVEPIVPDLAHPGCIYGEIRQCLRPCQGAVSEAEYRAEVQKVYSFLQTNGESNLRALVKARDEAASALQFEEAANLHKIVARVKEIGKCRDDLVCDARALAGIALTNGAGDRVFRLWPMVNGLWREPQEITVEENATPESLAEESTAWLPSVTTSSKETEGDAGEHLAILVRWYYSSWRDGSWYPLRADRKFNYSACRHGDFADAERPGTNRQSWFGSVRHPVVLRARLGQLLQRGFRHR